jgi:hypothetical protein
MQSSRGIDIKQGSSHRSGHRRNQSWPPVFQVTAPSGTIKSLSEAQAEEQLKHIDDDPWSYFITPASDSDFIYDADAEQVSWNAGIATPPRRNVRKGHGYVFKQGLAERWDSFVVKRQEMVRNPPHQYVDNEMDSDNDNEAYIWPNTIEAELLDRTPSPDPQHRRPTSLTDTYDPYRERRERRARKKYTRTLSGHRHSWREPSPDIFTVSETASEYHIQDAESVVDDGKPMSRSAVELGRRAKL